MSQYQFQQAPIDEFRDAKELYLANLAAPLDGMWESGFIPLADHYQVSLNSEVVGYLIVNDDGYLLQFDAPDHQKSAFASAVESLGLKGAFVSTAEQTYLEVAKEHEKSSSTNALMYGEFSPLKSMLPFDPGARFINITLNGLEMVIHFAHKTLGANIEWLRGYYTLLINRSELYGLYLNGVLIGTGECRVSETQKPYADVGVIVSKEYRGKGNATKILKTLRQHCHKNKLIPICSTEVDNKAARKAIENAGFKSNNKIEQINFI